jgi:nucleoside-diphosphate-sugar epimerase
MPDSTPHADLFVTGATTPIGRAVVRQFAAAGYPVTGATTEGTAGSVKVRADGGAPAYPDPTRPGELRSIMRGADAASGAPLVIVHAESSQHFGVPLLRPTFDPAHIIASAKAVLEAAKTANTGQIVLISSILASLSSDGEHAPPAELLALADALRAAESAALESGIPAVVLRLGFVYGAEIEALSLALKAIKAGRALNVGERSHAGSGHGHGEPGGHAHGAQFGFIQAADAARAVRQAVEKQLQGVTLTVCDDQPATLADFAAYFAEAQSLSLVTPPAFLKRTLAPLAGAATKMVDALVALRLDADNTAAKSALDWTPQFRSFQHGIDDLLLSWRAAEMKR